ncbi:hypothetical protein RD792_013157 [Penstemon davidsonii]|uniref:Uncharacterized protein n=1 Tax=Penstemon davidsonii TaxID=160366 RepID=A0ABR0CSR2_9LAMI|nr:hypothetical protein RD792_013154 [Penstemon davidsonii]KAK4480100.1 hypothetical protein RD792_013157 [Penstemon davidsonii]
MAKPNGVIYSSAKTPQIFSMNQGVNHYKHNNQNLSTLKLKFHNKGIWPLGGKQSEFIGSHRSSLVCQSRGTHNTETKECVRHYGDRSNNSRPQMLFYLFWRSILSYRRIIYCFCISPQSGDDHSIETAKKISSAQGLAEACNFFYNDAKFMNERARNDIVLLSR